MKLKTIGVIAVSMLSTSAFAIDSWSGDRFIYSVTPEITSAYQINLNGKYGTADVISKNGTSYGSFIKSENGEINITMKSPISWTGLSEQQVPGTDKSVYMEVHSTLQSITISGNKNNVKIKESLTSCYKYNEYISGSNINGSFCEDYIVDSSKTKLVLRKELGNLDLDLKVGDKITVPTPEIGFSTAFVEVGENGEVSPVEEGFAPSLSLKKIINNDGKVVVSLEDGGEIVFGSTIEVAGLKRVLGVIRDGKGKRKRLVVGHIIKSEKIRHEALDYSGHYKTISANGSAYADGIVYKFNSDGFGGFEAKNADESIYKAVWKWVAKEGGVLSASRYRKEFGGLVKNSKELRSCIEFKELGCKVFSKRSYKVLSKDGNKHVMLRRIELIRESNDGVAPPTSSVHQSVWVLYKK